MTEQLISLVTRLLTPQATLADIGCHDGALLAEIGRRRPDVRLIGADLDAPAVQAARERGIDAVCTSATDLPWPSRSVDVTTLMDVLEHIPADLRGAVIAELARVTVPGGHLIVQVPYAGTFAAVDPQNLRHRFPRLYRLVGGIGNRDRAYADGEQAVVWHEHFSLEDLLTYFRSDWDVHETHYLGCLALPLADLACVPFHRTGRLASPLAKPLLALARWDASRDYGPRHGYEVQLVLRRRDDAPA